MKTYKLEINKQDFMKRLKECCYLKDIQDPNKDFNLKEEFKTYPLALTEYFFIGEVNETNFKLMISPYQRLSSENGLGYANIAAWSSVFTRTNSKIPFLLKALPALGIVYDFHLSRFYFTGEIIEQNDQTIIQFERKTLKTKMVFKIAICCFLMTLIPLTASYMQLTKVGILDYIIELLITFSLPIGVYLFYLSTTRKISEIFSSFIKKLKNKI